MNKYKILRVKREVRRFKKEHRKEIRLLIVLTLSFTIAFTWRQTIFDAFQSIVQIFASGKSLTILSILTSTAITIVSFLLIRLTSHVLKESPNEHN